MATDGHQKCISSQRLCAIKETLVTQPRGSGGAKNQIHFWFCNKKLAVIIKKEKACNRAHHKIDAYNAYFTNEKLGGKS